MLTLSRRVRELGTENAFVVLGEVAKLEAEGKEIVSFCIGQPDFPTPDHIRMAGIKAISENKTGYTPSPGIQPLREAVAAYFTKTRRVEVTAEEVVCGCGGKPFINYTILSVTDHGEGHEVIYPNPGFPIYKSQIDACGAVPVQLDLREGKNFNFDMDELRKKVNERTRLLILCSPQNPTGGVLSRAELEEVAEIVKPYPDLWIYSDEVYSGLVYDGQFESIAAVPGMKERTVIVDTTSKTYAMTGWRLGFALGPPWVMKAAVNIQSHATSNATSFAMRGAVAALAEGEADVERMVVAFERRRELVSTALEAIPGVTCRPPDGAFYVFPNVGACYRDGRQGSVQMAEYLLQQARVAVVPGVAFGDDDHVRLSFATSREQLQEGLARISEALAQGD